MARDLISRLSETLDELDRLAQAIPESSGQRMWDTSESGDVIDDYGRPVAVGAWDSDLGDTGRHIARWDPQAVLRLVGALRDLVRLHERVWIHPGAEHFNDAHLTKEPMPICASCVPEKQFRRENSWPCRTLIALAACFGITEEDPK